MLIVERILHYHAQIVDLINRTVKETANGMKMNGDFLNAFQNVFHIRNIYTHPNYVYLNQKF